MRTYTYRDLARLIEEALGEPVSRSTLRMAQANKHSTSTRAPRLTAGMPPPLPSPSPTSPARFDADHIDTWLRNHPRLTWKAAIERATASYAQGEPLEDVIRQGLTDGLSWRVITDLVNAPDGGNRTVAGIHKRYRHLTP